MRTKSVGYVLAAAAALVISPSPSPEARSASTHGDWRARLAREIEAAESDARFAARADGADVVAASAGTGTLRVRPRDAAITIEDSRSGSSHAFALRAASMGRAGGRSHTTLRDGRPKIRGASEIRVTRAPGVRESWRALPSGFEHGLEVDERPPGDGALEIELAVDGALAPRALTDDAVALDDARGVTVAHYAHLFVDDARGRTVPARMEVRGARIALVIDDSRARYPLVIDPLVGVEEAVLTASGGAADDSFGNAVAISADGTRAIVGSQRDSTAVASSGSARIFVRTGTTWTEEATLVASDAAFGAELGWSVAMTPDASRVVVGARSGSGYTGSAYVFTRVGTTWTEEARLAASGAALGDQIGTSVAISADGATALVGAPSDDRGAAFDAGSARVFVRSGATWTEEATLAASGAAAQDGLGFAVALAADASRAIVGAPFDDYAGGTGGSTNRGTVRVFLRSGSTWTEEATVRSDGPDYEQFGTSVAVSADAARMLVGAPTAAALFPGSAYFYGRSASTWTRETQVGALATPGDAVGSSVAFSSDGARGIVGKPVNLEPGTENAGSAWLFTKVGADWIEQGTLYSTGPGGNAFGAAVALTSDGSRALVGAPVDMPTGTERTGSARVFVISTPDGRPCTVPGDCPSGFCIDGVCCATSCGGGITTDCRACSIAAGGTTDGACTVRYGRPTCRGVADLCDVADTCAPTSMLCPVDRFATTGVCRASVGICDVAESCGGASAACPTDTFALAGTSCRASIDRCDAAESCSGLDAACPADGYAASSVVCRAAVSVCDEAESCTGVGAACPADASQPMGTDCGGAPTDACDAQDECTGGVGASASCAALVAVTGTACSMPSCTAGTATAAATCDGIASACPAGATSSCGAYACGAADCLRTCAADTDCAPGYACAFTVCMPSRSDAGPAGADAGTIRNDAGSVRSDGAPFGDAGPIGPGRGDSGGCGCRVAAPDTRGHAAVWWLGAGLLVLVAHRRRR